MKYKGKQILYHAIIVTTLIIIALVLTGCTSTSSEQSTPTITEDTTIGSEKTNIIGTETVQPVIYKESNAPKYNHGDVVSRSSGSGAIIGWLIVEYNPETDCYTTVQVSREIVGGVYTDNWIYFEWVPETFNRKLEERDKPFIIGHADQKTITTPTLPPPTPKPKYQLGDIVGRARGESTGMLIYWISPDEDRYQVGIVYYRNSKWVKTDDQNFFFSGCMGGCVCSEIEEKYPVILSPKGSRSYLVYGL